MRKELRIGFAIGGVLLAVLAVYVLTSGGKKPDIDAASEQGKTSETALGKPITPSPDSLKSDKSPGGDQATGSPSTPVASEKRGGSTPGDATASADKKSTDSVWDKAFLPLMTQTPSPSDKKEPAEKLAPNPAAPAVPAQPVAAGSGSDAVASAVPPTAPPDVAASGGSGISGPTTQPASLPGSASRTHVVQRGETLSSISAAAYGSPHFYPHIIRANPKIDPSKLRPGTTIVLPDIAEVRPHDVPGGAVAGAAVDASKEYRVQSGDSLYRISVKLYGRSDRAEKIYELNKQTIGPDQAKLRTGVVLKLPEAPTASASR